MAKSKSKTTSKSSNKIDLSKVETPQSTTLSNKLLLDTVQEMVAERAKENPKHPHVGVNEIAEHLSENGNIVVDGADIRRKLQKIRKKAPGYEGGKVGEVEMAPDNDRNPYDSPLVIQWANRYNKQKGIEYLVTLK